MNKKILIGIIATLLLMMFIVIIILLRDKRTFEAFFANQQTVLVDRTQEDGDVVISDVTNNSDDEFNLVYKYFNELGITGTIEKMTVESIGEGYAPDFIFENDTTYYYLLMNEESTYFAIVVNGQVITDMD